MKRFEAELIDAQWWDGTARKEEVAALVLDKRRVFRSTLTIRKTCCKK